MTQRMPTAALTHLSPPYEPCAQAAQQRQQDQQHDEDDDPHGNAGLAAALGRRRTRRGGRRVGEPRGREGRHRTARDLGLKGWEGVVKGG